MSAPRVRSWDHPNCPDCDTDVFVAGIPSTQFDAEYECHFCGAIFRGDSA